MLSIFVEWKGNGSLFGVKTIRACKIGKFVSKKISLLRAQEISPIIFFFLPSPFPLEKEEEISWNGGKSFQPGRVRREIHTYRYILAGRG